MTTSPLTAPVPVVPAAALRIEDMPAATRATLLEVLIHGSLPRAELARRLGLSRASLTRIARTLVEAGLLAEGETRLRAATGRPSEMLRVRSSARRFLGVKLTGDTLYAVVTDLGAEVTASTEHALRSSAVAEVVRQIAEAAHELAGDGAPLTSIGIAIAGRVRQNPGGAVVEHSAFLDWHHVELARLVREATGLACSVENDVQALTAAEHWFGAGAGLESMALVTVGTGIGCGLVVNGRLVEGGHSRPGQVSHTIVDPEGELCAHGHRGCASTMLVNEAVVAASGRPDATYEDVVGAARDGDPEALRAFERAGRALGVIIAEVANLVDPEKVVVSGDGIAVVAFAEASIRAGIAERLEREAVPVELDVRTWDVSEWARAGAALAVRSLLA